MTMFLRRAKNVVILHEQVFHFLSFIRCNDEISPPDIGEQELRLLTGFAWVQMFPFYQLDDILDCSSIQRVEWLRFAAHFGRRKSPSVPWHFGVVEQFFDNCSCNALLIWWPLYDKLTCLACLAVTTMKVASTAPRQVVYLWACGLVTCWIVHAVSSRVIMGLTKGTSLRLTDRVASAELMVNHSLALVDTFTTVWV